MQVLQTKIEYIDKVTGDVYLRSYGIKDDIVALNARFPWMAHSSKTDVHTFKNQPVILTPNLDHVINTDSFEAWDRDSRDPHIAIGSIEDIVENQNTKAFDFIWKVHDKRVAVAIKDGFLPKFVSPAIWSESFEVDDKGIVHYKNYRGVHLAIVKKPAFDENIAFISDNVCIGGSRCKQELAAVASFSKEITNQTFDFTEYDPYQILQKNFSVNMIEKESPNSKMADDEKKVVPYEEYLKQSKEIEKMNAKLQEAEKLKQEAIDEKAKVQTQLTEKTEDLNKRIEQDKRAEFGEYLKVIFDNDENKVKEKVEWALGKDFEKKDLEDLYGHIYEQKQKASEEEQNNANTDTSHSPSLSNTPATPSGVDTKAGIASGIAKDFRDSADVAMSLVNQRRRFP